jgi:hypothetical protein
MDEFGLNADPRKVRCLGDDDDGSEDDGLEDEDEDEGDEDDLLM